MSAAWNPGDLTSISVAVGLDVPTMRRTSGLWQDTAKTTAATVDGDTVKKITDPFVGTDYATTADFTLRFRQGMWCLGAAANGTSYGRINGIANTGTVPFVDAMRWAERAGAGVSCQPFSLGGGEHSLGYDSANNLKMAAWPGTAAASVAGVRVQTPQTLVGQWSGSAAFLRQNGASLFSGTTATTGNSLFNLGSAFSGAASSARADLCRIVYGPGTISAAELALLEAWLTAGDGHGITQPYLWFGFDYEYEVLQIFATSDFQTFTIYGNFYYPIGQANHSVRDPSVASWGGSYQLAHTWGGLRFGPFPKSQSVSIAALGSWPLEWSWNYDLDFTAAFVDGSGNRCFAPNLSARGSRLYCLAHCTNDATASPATFTGYYRSTTVANPTSSDWDGPTALTGSALPASLLDATHYYDGTDDWLIGKNLGASDSGRLKIMVSTGGYGGGYNSGRELTELDSTPAAATRPLIEGPAYYPKPGGGWYLFADRWASGAVQSEFITYRYEFTDWATLLSGAESLRNETVTTADRRTIRHGSMIAL